MISYLVLQERQSQTALQMSWIRLHSAWGMR
jgi:hypothetical protein